MRPTGFVGVDPGYTKLACVTLDAGGEFAGAFEWVRPRKVESPDDRLDAVMRMVPEALPPVAVEGRVVVVERPIIGASGNGSTAVLLSGVWGALVCQAVNAGAAAVLSPPPATWKKVVVGRGNAAKEDVAAWLAAFRPGLFERCAASQDRVDAACLALYGMDGLEAPGA